jgi:endothelin-converting enzyme/putative endopeptidase
MKKQFTKPVFCAFSVMLSLTAVKAQNTTTKEPGVNVSYMNTKISPSEDFFRYVNGTWLDKTEIPNDRTTWGSFNELIKKTDKDAMAILKEASKNPKYKSDTDQGKAVNLFTTVLDTVGRNKRGIEPLKPYLKKIDAIKNVTDLQNYLVEMEPEGGNDFFGIYIGADEKNSSKNSVSLNVSRLGLSDKD